MSALHKVMHLWRFVSIRYAQLTQDWSYTELGENGKRAKAAAHWHAISDRDISMATISLHLTPSNVAMVFRVVDKQSFLLDFVAGPI